MDEETYWATFEEHYIQSDWKYYSDADSDDDDDLRNIKLTSSAHATGSVHLTILATMNTAVGRLKDDRQRYQHKKDNYYKSYRMGMPQYNPFPFWESNYYKWLVYWVKKTNEHYYIAFAQLMEQCKIDLGPLVGEYNLSHPKVDKRIQKLVGQIQASFPYHLCHFNPNKIHLRTKAEIHWMERRILLMANAFPEKNPTSPFAILPNDMMRLICEFL
jgi:hypothetical protein